MKIGLVLDHFDPRRGGVEQWTKQFADRLLQAGHEIHVVAAGFGDDVDHHGIVPHRFTASRSRVACAQAAEDVLKQIDLDVIHDMGIGWYCDIFQPHGGSRRASFEQNLLMEPAWLRPGKRGITKLLPRYRDYDRLLTHQYTGEKKIYLALSEMVQHDFQRFHGVRDEQIRLIYNGVDTQRFSPDIRDVHRAETRRRLGLQDEVLFLIVAHNMKLKGVPALLQAAKHQTGNFHIAVVGGKRIAPFQKMANRLGLRQSVTFVGAVDDAVPYYAAADVYVQPTFYDPCSLVVLEALSCGLPVITTRFNGAGELMTPDQHGYILADPNDAATLSRQMRSLLDPERREQMSIAARQLAIQNSFEQNVERVISVYYEVAESKSRQQRRAFAA